MIHAAGEGVVNVANEAVRTNTVASEGGAKMSCGLFEVLQSITQIYFLAVHYDVEQRHRGTGIVGGLKLAISKQPVVKRKRGNHVEGCKVTWLANQT
jgi:hypothetical protein